MPIGPTSVIVVASQNPVKMEATRRGFEKMFPGTIFHLQAVAASSGVRQQPLSDAETLQGRATEPGTLPTSCRRRTTGWASKAG